MKKIMFNDRFGLTDAVLSGRKTQTRRFVTETVKNVIESFKDPILIVPVERLPDGVSCEEFCEEFVKQSHNKIMFVRNQEKIELGNSVDIIAEKMSAYKIDEEIAIAQSYKNAGIAEDKQVSKRIRLNSGKHAWQFMPASESAGWNNKMFVDSLLMPHRIKITNVRIERLQDISEEDCMKEGIMQKDGYYSLPVNERTDMGFITAKDAFRTLINRLNGKSTWEENPWVFVYDFKLVK